MWCWSVKRLPLSPSLETLTPTHASIHIIRTSTPHTCTQSRQSELSKNICLNVLARVSILSLPAPALPTCRATSLPLTIRALASKDERWAKHNRNKVSKHGSSSHVAAQTETEVCSFLRLVEFNYRMSVHLICQLSTVRSTARDASTCVYEYLARYPGWKNQWPFVIKVIDHTASLTGAIGILFGVTLSDTFAFRWNL